MQDIINFILNINNWIDVIYDRDLKSLLAMISDDNKYKQIIQV